MVRRGRGCTGRPAFNIGESQKDTMWHMKEIPMTPNFMGSPCDADSVSKGSCALQGLSEAIKVQNAMCCSIPGYVFQDQSSVEEVHVLPDLQRPGGTGTREMCSVAATTAWHW